MKNDLAQKNRIKEFLLPKPADSNISLIRSCLGYELGKDPVDDWATDSLFDQHFHSGRGSDKAVFFDQAVKSIYSDLLQSLRHDREEIENLKAEIKVLQNVISNFNNMISAEEKFDLELSQEIAEIEKLSIEIEVSDPKEWAPSIDEIDELLED